MNICMISDDFIPSKTGVGVHVKHISKELAARGHNIVVITTRRKGEPKFEVWNNVKVYRLFTAKVLDFYIAIPSKTTIRNILVDHGIEIMHFHYLGILLKRSLAVANSLGLKKTYTYNMTVDHLTQDSWFMKLFSRQIARAIVAFCNECDQLMVPSRELLNRIKEAGVHTNIHYVSNAVGFDNCKINTMRDRKNKFVVLYVGRLHPEKNIPYLLNAYALFAKERGKSELWIVGDGSLRSQLEDRCKSLGIISKVKFFGQVDHAQIEEYYTTASVFVLPSLVETQGMVAIEAMYAGLPVIVTDKIVSAADLVVDGKSGFIVDHRSIETLAEKLRFLFDRPSLRSQMGEEGKIRSSLFSTKRIVDKIESLYKTLVEKD